MRWVLVLAGVDGTPERSTPGTDHCHQMLLLSLLRRILRQRQKKGSDLPFADSQGASPPLLFFSELSNDICLCTAVHVCLWHEAAGMKPGMEWADSVSLTDCRYKGCNFSIRPWSRRKCLLLLSLRIAPAGAGWDPAEDHQQPAVLLCLPWRALPEHSCFLEPHGILGNSRTSHRSQPHCSCPVPVAQPVAGLRQCLPQSIST